MSAEAKKSASTDGQSVNTKQMYMELIKCERSRDFDRGLKVANRILKVAPEELDALLSKVVCLIQLGKFDDALQLIRKTPQLSSATFEKAYCEYRLNRSDEAVQTLESIEGKLDFRCQELYAQLLYRREKYAECYTLYADLMKNSQDDYEDERHTNFSAVVAQLAATRKDLKSVVTADDSYEQCYNEACRLLTVKKLDAAGQMLQKSLTLCQDTLTEEGVGEDEIAEELAILKTQLGYIEQMRGKTDIALRYYNDVIKQKSSDPTAIAVASNNFISLKKEGNLFDCRKKIKSCMSAGVEQKLTTAQLGAICLNNVLIQLYGNQLDACRQGIIELREKYQRHESAALMEAALAVRDKQFPKAIDVLSVQSTSGSTNSLTCSLTLAQLHMSDGKLKAAYEVLSGLKNIQHKPAVISLCVALSLAAEDRKSAEALLKSAVDWYKGADPKSDQLMSLLEQCANFHSTVKDYRKSAEYLEELRSLKPKDVNILGRLVKAYAQFDPKKASEISKDLEHVGPSATTLDVASLEDSSWILLGAKYGAKKATKAELTPKTGEEMKKKRKRNRKKILPKNYDPNVQPDPERWLPKYERSTYKKKKDKKQRDREVGRGTQGAATVAQELDSSNKPAAAADSPSSPKIGENPTSPGPRLQRPGGTQVKTKKKPQKKGGKW